MTNYINCECGARYPEKILDFAGVSVRARCPSCDGDPHGEREGREKALAEVLRLEKIVKATRLARIPRRFEDATLETFDLSVAENAERAFFYAAQYADKVADCVDKGVSMIFCGTFGTGKTHLAISLLKKALEAGKTGMFISARHIPLAIKEGFNRTKSELDAIKEWVEPELLIIDELRPSDLVGPNSDWGRQKIFGVLDDRYLDRKATIITSNMSKDVLTEMLSEEAVDRLCQGKLEERMPTFDWESYRK